ncbi:EAL domain-containing protein, partial [Thiolapillus sp.]|uniref:EAL domain-containing protein n=5 Tax=Thiolapillus sp. TaxID=2017437 RepID=UPI0025EE0159
SCCVVLGDQDGWGTNRLSKAESILGTGMSQNLSRGRRHAWLAYLKRLPIETLKIDRSFVSDIVDDPNDAVLVETIIVMAKHLGLRTIAEGVETREVLAFLEEKGCHNFQGYLFSRPVPFQALMDMGGSLLPDEMPAVKLVQRVV